MIEFISTDELLEELKTRFERCVFYGEKKRTEEETEYTFDYLGTYAEIYGCLHIAKLRISERFDTRPEVKE